MSWFRAEVDADPSLLKQPFVREWSLAAKNPVKARPFEPEVD